MSSGQQVGYIRVSSTDQNTLRQLADIKLDRVFEDKISGKNTNRPALQQMIEFVRAGDKVVVHSIDRMARNLLDLKTTVNRLVAKGVTVEFKSENLTFSADKSNPTAELMLNMMASFAEFERELINQRQREGIQAAKALGKPLGRRASLSPADVATIHKMLADGASKASIAISLKVSRATIYNALSAA